MFVILAKAGILKKIWAPALAGVTFWIFLLLALVAPAIAETLPRPTGRVVDAANILSASQESRLAALSAELERSTSDQLAIVTVASVDGQDAGAFARRLGNSWGVGQRYLDNGVLILLVARDRKVRISVGYGLEGLLTDECAAKVVAHMLPYFRKGLYGAGLEKGEHEIIEVLTSDPRRPQRKRR